MPDFREEVEKLGNVLRIIGEHYKGTLSQPRGFRFNPVQIFIRSVRRLLNQYESGVDVYEKYCITRQKRRRWNDFYSYMHEYTRPIVEMLYNKSSSEEIVAFAIEKINKKF